MNANENTIYYVVETILNKILKVIALRCLNALVILTDFENSFILFF
jgi:hypothetical protein